MKIKDLEVGSVYEVCKLDFGRWGVPVLFAKVVRNDQEHGIEINFISETGLLCDRFKYTNKSLSGYKITVCPEDVIFEKEISWVLIDKIPQRDGYDIDWDNRKFNMEIEVVEGQLYSTPKGFVKIKSISEGLITLLWWYIDPSNMWDEYQGSRKEDLIGRPEFKTIFKERKLKYDDFISNKKLDLFILIDEMPKRKGKIFNWEIGNYIDEIKVQENGCSKSYFRFKKCFTGLQSHGSRFYKVTIPLRKYVSWILSCLRVEQGQK